MAKTNVIKSDFVENYVFTDGSEFHWLTVPIVNLNGDNVETLVDQMRNVLDLMRALDNVMGLATPHGRNYQLQDDNAAHFAREAWQERRLLLNAMFKEMEEYAIKISEQRR